MAAGRTWARSMSSSVKQMVDCGYSRECSHCSACRPGSGGPRLSGSSLVNGCAGNSTIVSAARRVSGAGRTGWTHSTSHTARCMLMCSCQRRQCSSMSADRSGSSSCRGRDGSPRTTRPCWPICAPRPPTGEAHQASHRKASTAFKPGYITPRNTKTPPAASNKRPRLTYVAPCLMPACHASRRGRVDAPAPGDDSESPGVPAPAPVPVQPQGPVRAIFEDQPVASDAVHRTAVGAPPPEVGEIVLVLGALGRLRQHSEVTRLSSQTRPDRAPPSPASVVCDATAGEAKPRVTPSAAQSQDSSGPRSVVGSASTHPPSANRSRRPPPGLVLSGWRRAPAVNRG